MCPIQLNTAKFNFNLSFRRNITVIRGDGATGKTTLVKLIELVDQEDPAVRFTSNRQVELHTLSSKSWLYELEQYTGRNAIIILDEFSKFVSTKDFAKAVIKSGCYFVFITRDKLPNLTCSIHEIYSLSHSHKTTSLIPVYPEDCFGTIPHSPNFLTEDSNSGKDFFVHAFGSSNVFSASGKDNILKCLYSGSYSNSIIIVDGAAFGFILPEVLFNLAKYNY